MRYPCQFGVFEQCLYQLGLFGYFNDYWGFFVHMFVCVIHLFAALVVCSDLTCAVSVTSRSMLTSV